MMDALIDTRMDARRSQHGFTLIEMIVTLVIVALLSTIALPMAELTVRRNKEQELHSALREIRTALDAYKKAWDQGRIENSMDKSGYPESLEVLVDGVEDITAPEKRKIYFLRRIPRDPFSTDLTLSPSDTWGKRSYESSAKEPKEGDDIYDIYSLSDGVDLRGVPYREW